MTYARCSGRGRAGDRAPAPPRELAGVHGPARTIASAAAAAARSPGSDSVRQQDRRRRVGQHEGQPLRRVAPGPAARRRRPALRTASSADDQLRRALQARRPRAVRAHAEAAQVVREPVGARVQLARRSAASPPADQRRRASGVRAACASKSSGMHACARVLGAVAFHSASTCARSASASSGSAATAARASATDLRQHASRGSRRSARRSRLEQAVVYSTQPTMPRRRLAPARASGRTSPSRRRRAATRRQPEAGQLQPRPRGAFCHANITWKSGVCARLRAGWSSSTSLLEGHVLVLLGAERVPHPRQQLAEGGLAGEVRRAAPAC